MDTKKILISLTVLAALALSGCTSSDSETDAPAEESETTLDEGDASLDSGDEDIELSESDDALVSEETDELPEEPISEEAPPPEDVDSDVAAAEPILEEDSSGDIDEGAAADEAASAPPIADSTASDTPKSDDMFSDVGASSTNLAGGGFEDVAPKPQVSLKKMATVPFTKGGVLLNTIYIARPKDKLKDVAQKIFGNDDTSKLLIDNPRLKNSLKVGDKIYYNSPNRPDDSAQILTYYEDIGLPPQIHVVQGSESIRDFAKRTYGDSNSWKEIWAINQDMESKDAQPEGSQFRYWGADVGASPTLANNTPPPPPPQEEFTPPPPPPSMANNDIPPPPPPSMSDSEIPPPPPPSMGSVEPPPPPPPRAAELPPPPPPGRKSPSPGPDVEEAGGLDQETTFMLGAAGIGLFLLVALIAIRRKARAKRMRMTAGETQI